MKKYYWLGRCVHVLLLMISSQFFIYSQPPANTGSFEVKGICLVAPPRPFEINPFPEISDIAANWVAVIPYAAQRQGSAEVLFDKDRSYWWGEGTKGVKESIKLANESGLNIFLKPQVYVPGSWPGAVDFDDEESWAIWEKSYTEFILFYAALAEENGVPLFCIGTEYKLAVLKRTDFWIQLAQEVRRIYKGKIIYAANWDAYLENPLWDHMDMIGINAYFPLDTAATPSVNDLIDSWTEVEKEISSISEYHGIPVVFTEFGYMSVDHCAMEPWDYSKIARQRAVNEIAQSNAFEALFRVFAGKPYWYGGFMWKWYPQQLNRSRENDYTPQGKKAAIVMESWYNR